MDTNIQNELTKQEDIEQTIKKLEENSKLEPQAYKIAQTPSLNQAQDLLKSPQKPQEQNAQEQNMPLNFGDSFITDSAKLANEITNEVQTQEQTQENNDMIVPPDVSEGVKYQKYRNTGVDYFDKKGNLSLLDAYLAKQLGLKVSYNFHKIDMKVDNRTRNVNFTKAQNDFAQALSNFQKVGMGQVSIAKSASGNTLYDALTKIGDKTFLGFYNGLTDSRAANTSNKAIFAAAMNRGGKLLKSQEQELNSLFADTTNNAQRSAKVNAITLQNLIADLEVSLHTQKTSGIINPQVIQARQNMINTAKEAHAIFANGDWKSKESIKNNSIKLFAFMGEIQKYF